MRRHNTPPRKLAGMPASSQCLTSPVTGCTKTDPPSPGPGSGTLGTQPEESVATKASKSRKTTVMSLPAERDPGLSVFMLRLLVCYVVGQYPPRSSMSSSTWRVLSGYATYQRTPIRMTSLDLLYAPPLCHVTHCCINRFQAASRFDMPC